MLDRGYGGEFLLKVLNLVELHGGSLYTSTKNSKH